MDTSLLNNIVVEKRSTAYYGKYNYCARFHLPGARKTMYNRTIQEFNATINQLREEVEHYYEGRRASTLAWIGTIDQQHIAHFIGLKRKVRKSRELRIYVCYSDDIVKLYSNDPELFTDFIYPGFTGLQVYKSDHDGNREIMYFTTPPKHKYRTYLKYKMVDNDTRVHIRNIVEYNDLHPSLSFRRWLFDDHGSSRWVKGSYSISYDEESILTLLQLSLDTSLIGKHYELRQR